MSPSAILVSSGTVSAQIQITVAGQNGFQGTVTVALQGLPAGANTSASFPLSLNAGNGQAFTISLGGSVPVGNYTLTFSGTSGALSSGSSLLLTASATAVSGPTRDFKPQVIYQIVTDRFYDGDTSNNNPAQSAGMFDASKTNFNLYWGGDLTGIQQKLAYLAGMGVTAIWISPPLDNIDTAANYSGGMFAPFHGFWARDLQRVEEHFGDASNSWTAFDNLVAAAHQNGIRVIVDFAANHSNPTSTGEMGALLDNGVPFANFSTDPPPPNNLFHHNPSISNFNDLFQLQYYTLVDLADLNQENPQVDSCLKRAVLQLMQHGADAFRLDAVKHVTWGWEYTLANQAFTHGPTFLYGEWFLGGTNDLLYPAAVNFSNNSGIALLDFPLATAFRDVFGSNASFTEIDQTITAEDSVFLSPNDLVTFFDSHDLPRLLSLNNNQNRMNEALVLLLACRGVPVVLYGDEQYLHNDTNGGNDPYNRVWMNSFNTGSTAYEVVNLMSNLRRTNPAVAYGTSQQRWINSDVYILERQFFNSVVLSAVNKSDTASYNITGLLTSLPAGTYSDSLNSQMGGFAIQVAAGGAGGNPVTPFNLSPHTAAVWQFTAPAPSPEAGSLEPWVGQPNVGATLSGLGFGSSAGSVLFGTTSATVQSWSPTVVTFTVPAVAPGINNVTLQAGSGATSNALPFKVLTGPQVAVTFTVNSAPAGGSIYLTGNVLELGNSVLNPAIAVGPLLNDPQAPATTFFLDASVPANTMIQFQFFEVLANGSVVPEPVTHTYTAPATGVGAASVSW